MLQEEEIFYLLLPCCTRKEKEQTYMMLVIQLERININYICNVKFTLKMYVQFTFYCCLVWQGI